jgi:pentatricopeptide repeat protein
MQNVGALRMLGECSTRCHLKNVLTGRTMIFGHVKCGQGKKALGLFQQMQQEGVQPDSVTFVGVLKACASMVAIEEARCVHQDIIQSG